MGAASSCRSGPVPSGPSFWSPLDGPAPTLEPEAPSSQENQCPPGWTHLGPAGCSGGRPCPASFLSILRADELLRRQSQTSTRGGQLPSCLSEDNFCRMCHPVGQQWPFPCVLVCPYPCRMCFGLGFSEFSVEPQHHGCPWPWSAGALPPLSPHWSGTIAPLVCAKCALRGAHVFLMLISRTEPSNQELTVVRGENETML